MLLNSSRLGVNIDHVASLRQLRNTPYPSILKAAQECVAGGADQITVHLREDRRHIQDEDVFLLAEHLSVDLNLEMAATAEMLEFALKLKPHSICLVPENREERTTEGGLDFSNSTRNGFFKKTAEIATDNQILVSFFIEPNIKAVEMSYELKAQAVEFHTGALCLAHQKHDFVRFENEMEILKSAVQRAKTLGLLSHAGHGIAYDTAPRLGVLRDIKEFNIGHSIVCEALYLGLKAATHKMKEALLVR